MLVAERISNGWAYFTLCYQKAYGFPLRIVEMKGRIIEDHEHSVEVEYQAFADEDNIVGPTKRITLYKPNAYRFW